MTIRLTNEMRRIAINALLTQTFKKRETKAAKRVHETAIRLLKKKCGPKYKAFASLPKGWAPTESYLQFNIGGAWRWAQLIEPVVLPDDAGVYRNLEARDADAVPLVEALDLQAEIASERKELTRRANGIAARFNTAEALAKEWPLIAPFLPKENSQLPALPIAEVTEAFKKAAA